jgi:hypothetical protein
MDALEILKKAIAMRKPISYKYVLKNREVGIRYGNPYLIYTSSKDAVNISIWKTGGVKSDKKPIPAWREYSIKYMDEITILEDQPAFPIAKDYNPNLSRYSNFLAKVYTS